MAKFTDENGIKNALKEAFIIAETLTAAIPGDIPTLLQCCFKTLFNDTIRDDPSTKMRITTDVTPSMESVNYLVQILDSISLSRKGFFRPKKSPKAQAYLDVARSILIDGPEMSMNIDLSNCGQLPDRVYTLLQGTVWAILMQAQASPDITAPGQLRPRGEPDSRGLWFLCKKFFFTLQVAEKEGEVSYFGENRSLYRLYACRLYELTLAMDATPRFVRLRDLPPVVRAFGLNCGTALFITPKGVYGRAPAGNILFGEEFRSDQLGLLWPTCTTVTRARFSLCPAVSVYEAGLPAWRKDRLATLVHVDPGLALIATPVGIVAAGFRSYFFTGKASVGWSMEERLRFTPAVLPRDFVPDSWIIHDTIAILRHGARTLITGDNAVGELGLGHTDAVYCPVEHSLEIDDVIPCTMFNLFLSGDQVLFAGTPPKVLGGLLPCLISEDVDCLLPIPLMFPRPLKGLACTSTFLVTVFEGDTRVVFSQGGLDLVNFAQSETCTEYNFPYEVSAATVPQGRTLSHETLVFLRACSGEWFEVDMSNSAKSPTPRPAVPNSAAKVLLVKSVDVAASVDPTPLE
ncbi:hypothetical protein J8273_6900 [Carpediemonas membranifera]|uniref:Uncharacterized protein n=1 Tax=Carpediemonas membranifera TaxID=201153 RepID=A0A8J6B2X4_9EUKA|nr:hypothetical protein J8273_6900 [Carpediemonas membranifera]|eukprot:KAG9391832.1 hypothetical protein J8273_6900 [Carpediemonas membranifera]